MRALISGPSQRVWIAEAVDAPLGGASCKSGLRYRFRAGGSADKEECKDGTWIKTEIEWSVSGGGLDILSFKLGEVLFEATFVQGPSDLQLELESFPEGKDISHQAISMTYLLD